MVRPLIEAKLCSYSFSFSLTSQRKSCFKYSLRSPVELKVEIEP